MLNRSCLGFPSTHVYAQGSGAGEYQFGKFPSEMRPQCITHSHTFMPLPGTPMQFMPPGSVGRTTRATFEKLSQRGQEWGDWQEQEEIAHAITTFRRELRGETPTGQRSGV